MRRLIGVGLAVLTAAACSNPPPQAARSTTIKPTYDAKTDRLMEFGSPSGPRTNFRKAELDAAEAAAGQK